MSDLVIVGMPLGRWQTNCYVVGDREAGTCVVIDPGETAAPRVPDLLERLDLTCEAILLTHGHLDHHWSAPELAETFDCEVHLHPDDRWIWTSRRRPSATCRPRRSPSSSASTGSRATSAWSTSPRTRRWCAAA